LNKGLGFVSAMDAMNDSKEENLLFHKNTPKKARKPKLQNFLKSPQYPTTNSDLFIQNEEQKII
jgi:hypothetical protein